MKESKELALLKDYTMMFLGLAGLIVALVAIMVLTVACFMAGMTILEWVWKSLGH
jgi:hypothetical protein